MLDTNVIVSGTIGNSGSPFIILEAWRKGRFILITSQTLIDEVERVFCYPRIQKKYHITEKQVTNALKNLINYSIATPRNIKLSVITKDPPDNEVLIAALEGEADYIVTGDADLLELKSYKGIKIVLPSEFLELLGEN